MKKIKKLRIIGICKKSEKVSSFWSGTFTGSAEYGLSERSRLLSMIKLMISFIKAMILTWREMGAAF